MRELPTRPARVVCLWVALRCRYQDHADAGARSSAWLERTPDKREAGGSNPPGPIPINPCPAVTSQSADVSVALRFGVIPTVCSDGWMGSRLLSVLWAADGQASNLNRTGHKTLPSIPPDAVLETAGLHQPALEVSVPASYQHPARSAP